MSNIGCGISFVCLILTVMIHVCFKNLWKLMASKVLVNLCCSLAVTNLIFLISMRAFTMKIIIVCKTMAAMLHYFLLTSLMWMTVEALHVCLALFLTLRTYQKSFMVRSSILAWGLPAVIVIITLAINSTNNYIRIGTGCWLSKIPFYAAFLSPVVIMLIFNLTIFSIAIQQLIKMQNNKTFAHKARKVRVFGVVGLFFLLGLPWIFAFFAFDAAAEAFKFLFVTFNTLQGMFIFIFYCIYKKDTREVVSFQALVMKEKLNQKN
ncbi:adhesion G-protein coupled receptor G2 [Octopus bimaculoides]|uniref:adhesion G-protein coupled receptor G2 n=1 Tax=Octopus bimaculoides TaxID=37653 RepID=UPI00071E1F6C|nr:adhesion G-protein coupled receptor G2 [Octopus bimaculoides]|eukprot:XP_014771756.1 PREDICTED: adhesion G-protein coupled receptor G2-like [Octopus bimaculoides]